ncbi:MAG: glycosyltransferase family 2 protein [bacterium]
MIQGGKRFEKLVSNEKPLLSIITVVYNGVNFIERTLLNIINQSFTDYELIVIDGASTDGTIDVLKKYESDIDYWISEKDNGIYDAMNKGVNKARGKWLNFMNSSDIFYNNTVLTNIFNHKLNDISVIYSDWYITDVIKNPNKIIFKEGSWEKGYILHQSIIYKKELHDKYGKYIVCKQKLISDYIFFSQIEPKLVIKTTFPISINDMSGVSYGSWSSDQREVVNFLLNKQNKMNLILNLLIISLKQIIKRIINYK